MNLKTIITNTNSYTEDILLYQSGTVNHISYIPKKESHHRHMDTFVLEIDQRFDTHKRMLKCFLLLWRLL